MNRRRLAAACVFLTLSSAAAETKPKARQSRLTGTVLKASSKIAPGADGPVFREGRLTMTDKADRTEELKATPRTKITLDGLPAKFKTATPGTIVVRALYDPDTKELSKLDLKSAPRLEAPAAAAPGVVTGEVANTDLLKGTLSVRTGPKNSREFAVTERTAIIGKNGQSLAFESIKIGDAVEVNSNDGNTAADVRVISAP